MSITVTNKVFVFSDPVALGQASGSHAAEIIKQTLLEKGKASIILATGTSQFETLHQIVSEKGIDWSRVTLFHLDEYMGIPITAKASFRKYLTERFIEKVPPLQAIHLINGEAKPDDECNRLASLIHQQTIDLALVGIGENGHLAFNDPPADFATEAPYIVVTLDEACRQQQYNEGWFDSLEAVPTQAISMSIKQIMKSKKIICSVPDNRKALAVKNTLEAPISNQVPASILREHTDCSIYLDTAAAALLQNKGS